jgi:hypothetical protein
MVLSAWFTRLLKTLAWQMFFPRPTVQDTVPYVIQGSYCLEFF